MKNIIVLWMMVGSVFASAVTNYDNIIKQSNTAINSGGKIIAPWLEVFIAWAPAMAIVGAVIGVWMYERNKAKEERKDGTFKIIIIAIVVAFIAVIGLEFLISGIMEYLTSDGDLGTTIRQDYWKSIFDGTGGTGTTVSGSEDGG